MSARKLLTDLDCTGQQLTGSPTILTPTIASLVNANHSHQNAAGGGTLAEAALALTDITTNNVSTTKHGFCPKAPNDIAKYLDGTAAFTLVPSRIWLSTTTASNSATVDIVFPSSSATFIAYEIAFSNLVPATNAVDFWVRVSLDGGSTYKSGATDYAQANGGTGSADTSFGIGNSGGRSALAPSVIGGNHLSNAAGSSNGGLLQVFSPSTSANKCQIGWQGTWFSSLGGYTTVATVGSGCYLTAGAVNAIRFLFSSGNITSGSFSLYGIR